MTEWQPSSRSCFVCGRDNTLGFRTKWENDREAGEVRASVTVPEHFNGYPGIVHGGIVATLLDEAVARCVLLDGDFEDLMVTAKLEVVFRRPVPTDTPLLLSGRLVERTGSRAVARARLRLPDGTVAARAEALLARPPESLAKSWSAERPYWRVDDI
jgi:uncharacterized protein (TIGR00369 family)